jgi:hypothetical protein
MKLHHRAIRRQRLNETSLGVERCRKDDVPLDQRRRLVHLLVQDGVPDDASTVLDVSENLVQALNGANDYALLLDKERIRRFEISLVNLPFRRQSQLQCG